MLNYKVLITFQSLRDTVFHALDTGNLIRALQEERASVLLNTFLLESETGESKQKTKAKKKNVLDNNILSSLKQTDR